VTEYDNAACRPAAQADNEPSAAADRDLAAGPRAGQRHGPGGRWRGPVRRRHPAPFRFARSGFIEYDRVLFFSDAVFAIAITLLAIDLKVPRSGGLSCAHNVTLCRLGIDQPGLISFGISFAVIGRFWLGHHVIFRYILALDRPLISINLLFLGTIAMLPYPTALLNLTSNPTTAGIVFYAICTAAAGLGECAIWLYATRPGRGLAAPSAAAIRVRIALRIGRVPVVFLASIPVAFAAPQDAPYVWILIVVLGLVINRFVPEPDEPGPAGDQILAAGDQVPATGDQIPG